MVIRVQNPAWRHNVACQLVATAHGKQSSGHSANMNKTPELLDDDAHLLHADICLQTCETVPDDHSPFLSAGQNAQGAQLGTTSLRSSLMWSTSSMASGIPGTRPQRSTSGYWTTTRDHSCDLSRVADKFLNFRTSHVQQATTVSHTAKLQQRQVPRLEETVDVVQQTHLRAGCLKGGTC